jgi:dolichol-phosphate mannosyltransferase
VSVEHPQITVILPTLNEADNLPLVVPRIAAALNGRSFEILVIDDASSDDTPRVCAELAQHFPLALHVRTQPKDGLSGAVLHGMSLARGDIFVVMDADLQHPPERLPDLIAPLERGEADFVLGSRYVSGGSMQESWGPMRRLNSRIATFLARPFAGHTHDPMSGFLALRRSTFARAERLTPMGYKVGLELMCKCRVRNVREVPIHFSTRARGESKLTLTQQFRYLEHLSRLYDFYYPRAAPMAKFLIATACGWLVAFAPYASMLAHGVNPWLAIAASYLLAIATTAVFHFRYVRAQREFLVARHPWLDFVVISAAEWVICTAAAFWLLRRLYAPGALELFIIPFGAATLARYVMRKELMQDVRGLRKDLRKEELL